MSENTHTKENTRHSTIRELPVLPSEDLVLFPHMVVSWVVEQPNLVKLVDDALATDRTVAVICTKKAEDKKPFSYHKVGTVGLILRMAKNEEGHARLIVQGVTRVRLLEITEEEPYVKAKVEPVQNIDSHEIETQALVVNVRQVFSKVLELSPNLSKELGMMIMSVDDSGTLADVVISHLNISTDDKQAVLEALDVKERLKAALRILTQQLEILELGHKIQSQVKGQVEKTQKEYFLREQLKAIKEELGEGEEKPDEIEELRKKLEVKGLPEDAMKEAKRELDRLSRMHPFAPEYTVARTYIDWLLELPWNEFTEDHLDLDQAERILNEDHYDLEKVKDRIIEYLAVRKLKPDAKGTILCFYGPPGTGKTSLGKSIARAMGRRFLRIALGGMRDEAEIRGHRRTYVGAMPGRIVQGIRKAGVKNPVLMLDEVDKIGVDFRGDPASALLEVLDPEQNITFTDHYLGVEFDLSNVIFIATANVLDTIPSPLLDRLEVLELSGYTLEEKLEIARKYLIPRQIEAHGLTRRNLTINKTALSRIISAYTREAGVRNLERQIAAVCRGVAKQVAKGRTDKVQINIKGLEQYLGPHKFTAEVAERTKVPGVATGLAWTPSGGEILFVEAGKMNGSGKILLTGKLGDVMKESAQTALSFVRSKGSDLGIPTDAFRDKDIHVHVPSGAIPKDGPSAGVAICMALISLFTGCPVRPEVAMTGEITLRGLVLPVGGIKEKVLGAHRAGIKEIILPKRNARDLDEIPSHVRDTLKFHLISRIDDAVSVVFKSKRRKRHQVDTSR
ncbi:MAG: endopeptidase La [Deltaproteobacteria bacterium]|nr:endopeptidase La [Deltaproteobacteria bacterium]MBW1946854.1 endopeptidase La [Deltaproteobacteria bacterium]MBW1966942.1 endopeptidase La [Deltaproteobacteria bacterium]MBW2097414.1 endopeptidase La [Deltaproteobacteria bacterium]